MTQLILCHIGIGIPNYTQYCLRQIRAFNPETEIFFLTNKENFTDKIFNEYSVKSINIDDYYHPKIKDFENSFNYSKNDFWTVTATRLFYIQKFIEIERLINVYHFENDILLYYNLQDYHNIFVETYENIAITTGGPDKNMTGFMFIKNHNSLELMLDFFIDRLNTFGISGLIKKYGMDMVNEMTLMKAYDFETDDSKMKNLPILPFGEHSKDYDKFHSLFDPATWGQFVGGTRNLGPGAKPEDHYIGQLLIKNPDWKVIWKNMEGKRIPYFKYNENEIKINNLHIHSKNLHLYVSK